MRVVSPPTDQLWVQAGTHADSLLSQISNAPNLDVSQSRDILSQGCSEADVGIIKRTRFDGTRLRRAWFRSHPLSSD